MGKREKEGWEGEGGRGGERGGGDKKHIFEYSTCMDIFLINKLT